MICHYLFVEMIRKPTSDVGNISSTFQDLKDNKDCADATHVSAGDQSPMVIPRVKHVFAQSKGLCRFSVSRFVLYLVTLSLPWFFHQK